MTLPGSLQKYVKFLVLQKDNDMLQSHLPPKLSLGVWLGVESLISAGL